MKPEDIFSEETSDRSGPGAAGHLRYLLTAYLFDSISKEGRREVEDHLRGCADCRKELEELRSTLAQVEYTLGTRMEGEKPYSFEAHRIERVLAASKEKRPLDRLRSWKLWVPLAAAVLVVGFILPTLMSVRGRRYEAVLTQASAPASSNAAQHFKEWNSRGANLPFDAAGSTEKAPATELAAVGVETDGKRDWAAERQSEERLIRPGALGLDRRARSSVVGDKLADETKPSEAPPPAPAKPRAPPPQVALRSKLQSRPDAPERLARELKEIDALQAVGGQAGGVSTVEEEAAPKQRLSELSRDKDGSRDLGRLGGAKAPGRSLGSVLAPADAEGQKVAPALPAATAPAPASEPAQVAQLDGERVESFELAKGLSDAKKRENAFGAIVAGGESGKAYKEVQDLQDHYYQKLNADGVTGTNQMFGWALPYRTEGKAGELGQAVDPRLEHALRAYTYYRALDPALTPQQFSMRLLPIPAPVVGDEGLGEEGFKKRYGVNPFVDTRRDHLSTFGMDVDTASYTLARSLLRAGKLPDAKTVRVEEFVNHFQEECASDPGAVFSVFSEGGPSAFGEGLDLLKVTVKARELQPNERKDAVLTFAVDASGSMHLDNRLSLVREALKTLVGSLGPGDRVGIIGFDAHAYLVLPHTTVRERERILGAIDSLAPGGGTNVEAGLDLAYRVADEAFQARAVNRVVLCSDGVANAGARGPEDVLKKVRVFADRGIYISCVGFGMGRYNDAMLETLAKRGNGNYAYVDTPAAAEDIFRKNLPGTLQVLAQDAKVQVDFNPEVVSHYRLLGYEKRDIADKDFRNDKVDSGDVGPGTSVTVLYEIQRQPRASGDLGRIFLRYRDTGTSRVDEVSYPLSPGVLATSLKESSDRLRFIACVAETAELLRGSYWARDGSFVKVLGVLASLSPEYRARPEWNEVAELVGRAQALSVARMAAK